MAYKLNKISGLNVFYNRGTLVGLWTILVILSSCASDQMKCLGIVDTVITHPPGDIFIKYGNPLNITCRGENYTADDFEFRLNNSYVEYQTNLNETTKMLYIEKPEIQTKTYYCVNKKTFRNCLNTVVVDTEPKEIKNFSCIATNLESLNCSWIAPKQEDEPIYKISFFVSKKLQQPIIATKVKTGNVFSCYAIWNLSSMPMYRYDLKTYKFTIEAINDFGSITQNFSIDHYSILKAERPSNFKTLSISTHTATLQWEIPPRINHLMDDETNIQHKIIYKMPELNETEYILYTSYSHGKGNKFHFQLNLPYAYLKYRVSIAIRPELNSSNGIWSEYTTIELRTESELPSRPPEIPAGAFTMTPYENNNRHINVYWKQLEKYEQNGPNFTYAVNVTCEKPIKIDDQPQNSNSIQLKNVSSGEIFVSVKSRNTVSLSKDTSYLYIPPESKMLNKKITSFTKIIKKNSTTYELTWDPLYDIDNYTLFWCQSNSSQVCSSRVDYKVLGPTHKSYVIPLDKPGYQFALSANKGHQTSGMIWANCAVSEEYYDISEFLLDVDLKKAGKFSLELEWSMSCKFGDGIIRGFNVTVCPLEENTKKCPGNQSFFTYTNNSSINITDLLPFKDYDIQVYPHLGNGFRKVQRKNFIATTQEDVPSEPTNVTVSKVTSHSLKLLWYPPLEKNGIIKIYKIYINGKRDIVIPAHKNGLLHIETSVGGLTAFTNYTIAIQACNSFCSKNKTGIVTTKIGPPNSLAAPIINGSIVSWTEPDSANLHHLLGLYQVLRTFDGKNETYNITDTTQLQMRIDRCKGGHTEEKYRVRAVFFDDDPKHGVRAYNVNIVSSPEPKENVRLEYPGDWSSESQIICTYNKIDNEMIMPIVLSAIIIISLIAYLILKYYKKDQKQKNIKPEYPIDVIPQTKEQGKNRTTFIKKSPDEHHLLPQIEPEISLNYDNFGANESTGSTDISHSSQENYEEVSSDNRSDNTLPISGGDEIIDNKQELQENQNTFSTSKEISPENSPNLNDQIPITNQNLKSQSGYVQRPLANIPPTMPSIRHVNNDSSAMSHYSVKPSFMNFPKLGPSPTKSPGPESLPNIPALAPVSKDSSYIQLHSLDTLPSQFKMDLRDPVMKPPTTNGYIKQEDIDKHMNILTRGQLSDVTNIGDPTMSPDAYLKLSRTTDPLRDNNVSKMLESHHH